MVQVNPLILIVSLAIAIFANATRSQYDESQNQQPVTQAAEANLPECHFGTTPTTRVPFWHRIREQQCLKHWSQWDGNAEERRKGYPITTVIDWPLSTSTREERGISQWRGRGFQSGDIERTALRNQDGTRAQIGPAGDRFGTANGRVGAANGRVGTANGANARVKNGNNEHGASAPRGVGDALRRLACARDEDALSVGRGLGLCPSVVEAVFSGDRHLSVRYIEMVASYLGARLEVRV